MTRSQNRVPQVRDQTKIYAHEYVNPENEGKIFSTPDELKTLAETQRIQESNMDLRANRKLRGEYAQKVFWYLVIYSSFVGGLLVASGIDKSGFKLDDRVLYFLVGSTAVSAIGLVLAVTNGLFKPLK